MVEKITVNPESIRGYGNVLMSKSASDWDRYSTTVTKTTDTVYGATEPVFQLSPKTYTLSFDSASYTTGDGTVLVTVTVMDGAYMVSGATVTVTGGGGTGTGTTTGAGTATITVTGITESGTLTASYWASQATATITYQGSSYSLAFSQSTYMTDMFDGVTVICTLKDGNTPMSGETVTFTWDDPLGPQSTTATTDSSGKATHYFDYWDIGSYPVTITATYDTVSATCTIVDAL